MSGHKTLTQLVKEKRITAVEANRIKKTFIDTASIDMGGLDRLQLHASRYGMSLERFADSFYYKLVDIEHSDGRKTLLGNNKRKKLQAYIDLADLLYHIEPLYDKKDSFGNLLPFRESVKRKGIVDKFPQAKIMLDEMLDVDKDFFKSDYYYNKVSADGAYGIMPYILGLEKANFNCTAPIGIPRYENGKFIPQLYTFSKSNIDIIYIADAIQGVYWMSLHPSEILSMQGDIEKAHGKCLVVGLGLGYYAANLAMKDNVESVTVVERDIRIIQLFAKYILPSLDCKEKITIVQADAFDYLDNLEDGLYDYCNIDIWFDVRDEDVFYSAVKSSLRFKETEFTFWIEESFVFILMSRIAEMYATENDMGKLRGIRLFDTQVFLNSFAYAFRDMYESDILNDFSLLFNLEWFKDAYKKVLAVVPGPISREVSTTSKSEERARHDMINRRLQNI